MTVVTRRLLRSSTAGIIAGLLAALYLPAIFYEGMLLPASLILFLNSIFLFLMVPETGPPGPPRLLAAGFVLGLSAMAKPVAILLALPAIVHIFLRLKKGFGGAFLRHSAALVIGMIFAIMPLSIRNARISGHFIPLTTGGGINFYIGNNPEANGFYAVPSYKGQRLGIDPEKQRERMYELAESEAGRPLSPGEVSSFWLRRGLRYISDDPGRWSSLTWNKFLFFFNRYERSNVENLEFHGRFGGILALPLPGYWIVVSLGLLGIFMSRDRWQRLWLPYGGLLVYLTAALAFYVTARYRLPVVTFLLPLAGAAVTGLLKMLRDRKLTDLALMAAALAVLLFFTGMTVARDTPFGEARQLVRLGKVHARSGETEKARKVWKEALRIDPGHEAAAEALRHLPPEE
jgi:hypothetical protein